MYVPINYNITAISPKKPSLKRSSSTLNLWEGIELKRKKSSQDGDFFFDAEKTHSQSQQETICQQFISRIRDKYPDCYLSLGDHDKITVFEFLQSGTPCHFAAAHSDYKLLDMLINLGVDSNQKDEYLETPLMVACKSTKKAGVNLQKIKKTFDCLVKGVDNLLEKDRMGKFPLEYLGESSYWTSKDVLDYIKKLSHEELLVAVRVLHSIFSIDLVNFFVEKDIPIDVPDEEGFTPMMRAIEKRNPTLFGHYFFLNCDLFVKNHMGESTIDMIVKNDVLDNKQLLNMLQTLSQKKVELATVLLFPLHPIIYREIPWKKYEPIKSDRLELVRFLLAAGIPIDLFDDYGNTPLYMAVDKGDTAYITFLCENGANPGLERPFQKVSSGFSSPQALLNHKKELIHNRISMVKSGELKENEKNSLVALDAKLREYGIIQELLSKALTFRPKTDAPTIYQQFDSKF